MKAAERNLLHVIFLVSRFGLDFDFSLDLVPSAEETEKFYIVQQLIGHGSVHIQLF